MTSSTIHAREPVGGDSQPLVETEHDAISSHLEDAAHFPGGRAEEFCRPRTELEVSALLRSRAKLLAIGAQSSVTGGATPDGGVIVSTERISRIEQLDSGRVRAGAGVPLAVLQKHLFERGAWFPPVPTFMGAFVGGIVATNAAGAATYKYGTTRAWVDGLTVVLACGHVLDLTRGVTRSEAGAFSVTCGHGTRVVRHGSYRLPHVPKCSAGYFAEPEMDLIDLFVGSEGTLGIVIDATLRVLPAPPAVAVALIPVDSESRAIRLVGELRQASERTWQERDPRGIDVAAIEYLDRRCLALLKEDGIDRKADVRVGPSAEVVLLVQLELPAGIDATRAFDEIEAALGPEPPDTPLGRFCRTLNEHGLLEETELAMPGDARRTEQLLAFREGAPAGVNQRVGAAKRDRDSRIEKTAADMIVPFEHFGEMMDLYRRGFESRGLDYAIWGHISDGNVHPNALPRSYEDVVAAKQAILEFGRKVVRLGGSPLAEHGVGRNPIKQQLLREMFGEAAVGEMRAVKGALDPDWKLAPGVIFSRD